MSSAKICGVSSEALMGCGAGIQTTCTLGSRRHHVGSNIILLHVVDRVREDLTAIGACANPLDLDSLSVLHIECFNPVDQHTLTPTNFSMYYSQS